MSTFGPSYSLTLSRGEKTLHSWTITATDPMDMMGQLPGSQEVAGRITLHEQRSGTAQDYIGWAADFIIHAAGEFNPGELVSKGQVRDLLADNCNLSLLVIRQIVDIIWEQKI
jgi:hypothetical protein